MTNVVIISGANSSNSRVIGVQKYIERVVGDAKSVEVHRLPAEDLISANFKSETILAANGLVEKAEVVIILTPVYKAAYSGILKTYLDLLPQKGLENKIVIPVAVGGTLHHLLAIDYALKPVLSALGATNILQGVYILDQSIQKTDNDFILDQEISERINHQLQQVLGKAVVI